METPVVIAEALFFISTMLLAIIIRMRCAPAMEKPHVLKSCFGRGPCVDHGPLCHPLAMKLLILLVTVGSFILPFFIIPTTVHPFMGWGIFLLGSLSLLIVVIITFQLPVLALLTPWIGGVGALLVLAYPFYKNGIVRALSIAGYTAMATPFLWWAVKEVSAIVDRSSQREPLMAYTSVRTEPPSDTLMKIC